jgi:hypothetical protein
MIIVLEAGHLSLRSILRLLARKMLRAFLAALHYTEPLLLRKNTVLVLLQNQYKTPT